MWNVALYFDRRAYVCLKKLQKWSSRTWIKYLKKMCFFVRPACVNYFSSHGKNTDIPQRRSNKVEVKRATSRTKAIVWHWNEWVSRYFHTGIDKNVKHEHLHLLYCPSMYVYKYIEIILNRLPNLPILHTQTPTQRPWYAIAIGRQ